MLIISTHAALRKGYYIEFSFLNEILTHNKFDYYYIRHSLWGDFNSNFNLYLNGISKKESTLFTIKKPAPLRYITNIISTVIFLLKYAKRENSNYIFIGINPLNALAGLILKKCNKIHKVVFYTADYSHKRFNNFLLNTIYHRIDKYCACEADQVWNVSTRIQMVREQLGTEKSRNIFVPNVPPLHLTSKINSKHVKTTLISLGALKTHLDYYGLFDAVSILNN
ncbi:MAG TPA: hypothetical protein ENN45_00425, partial [Bacteroidetes bacterium]|nr:hypothetical protein [Bacteroidota bacterium]